jgi:hypothetical protein
MKFWFSFKVKFVFEVGFEKIWLEDHLEIPREVAFEIAFDGELKSCRQIASKIRLEGERDGKRKRRRK